MKAEALTLSQQGFVSEPGKQFSSKGLARVCVWDAFHPRYGGLYQTKRKK